MNIYIKFTTSHILGSKKLDFLLFVHYQIITDAYLNFISASSFTFKNYTESQKRVPYAPGNRILPFLHTEKLFLNYL